MATRSQASLPYGVGQFNLRWAIAIVVLLAVLGLGAYAYSRQLTDGMIVTGLRDVGTRGGAPWGLYIAFELYAAGVGFGSMLLLGAIGVLGLSHLRPLTRTLGLMTVAGLVAGYLAVMADLGQPLRGIVNIARYARPMSPFFGTFTVGLVTSVVATWVYVYLDSRRDAAILARRPTRWSRWMRLVAAGYRDTPAEQNRHRHTSRVLALVLLALGIAAGSSSGFVFAVGVARPGWYSALQAPAFVVLGSAAAVGVVIIIATVLRAALPERERLHMRVFIWLNNIMLGLVFIYLYFLLAEQITSGYAGHHHEVRLTDVLLRGEYAWLFWLTAGLLLVSFFLSAGQAVLRRYSLWLIVLAAVLVNLGALAKRFLIVVPSLTHGNLLPYPAGEYSPTWVEYSVVIGLVALGFLLFVLFIKVFPIMGVQRE